MIAVHRAYDDKPARGKKFLVERLWPRGIKKEVKTLSERIKALSGASGEEADGKSLSVALAGIPKDEAVRLIKDLESQMRTAAKQLEFEKAAQLRDQIIEIRRSMIE